MLSRRVLGAVLGLAAVLTFCFAGTAFAQEEAYGGLVIPNAATVRENGFLEVQFTSPKAGGMDGVVQVSENLELAGFTSAGISAQLSAPGHVVTIFGDPVTYVYKINEEAGGEVSVALTEAECTDGTGALYTMRDERWTAPVLAEDATQGEPLPASLEAAGVMTGPAEEELPAGGVLEIAFQSPAGGGLDGEIQVSENLTFLGMRSTDIGEQLSAPNHVVSLFADPVVYSYRIDARPGEQVSVELLNGHTADAQRNLYTVPQQRWSGIVGAPDPSAVAAPNVSRTPSGVPAAETPEEFMTAPSEAFSGRHVEVEFTSPGDGGMEATIETSSNLEFEGLRGGFLSAELSSERKAVSLFGEPLTYVYRVNAKPGEEISVALTQGQQSDGNCSMTPVEPETWSCTVQGISDDAPSDNAFEAVMDVPAAQELVPGAVIDVDFTGPLSGGMDGVVTTSANLELVEVVGAGNSARLSSQEQVRSLLGVPVTYRYRVTGGAGEAVYVRLTDGRTADAVSSAASRVRNQIWMGVVQEASAGGTLIVPAAGSGIGIEAGGAYLTGAEQVGTVGMLKQQLTVPAGMDLQVLDAGGSALGDAARLATGQIVRVSQDGSETGRCTIVIAGDATGSGSLSIGQLVRVAAACTGGPDLSGAYRAAADLNKNGRLDVGDLARLANMIRVHR